jgi:hypothetical protein
VQQVPATAWLIDVRSGTKTTLFESHEEAVWYTAFDNTDHQAVIGIRSFKQERMTEAVRFSLDGRELGREPWLGEGPWDLRSWSWEPGKPLCLAASDGAEVYGQFYPGVSCGSISRDGRWMIYDTNSRDIEGSGRFFDRWVVDLASGARKQMLSDARQCQGDSFYGAQWSPSSEYVFFADCAERGRTFVGHASSGRTRQIGTGIPNIEQMPAWSPVEDRLVYRGEGGAVVIEDVASLAAIQVPELKWQASFDSMGRYVYSPSELSPPKDSPGSVTTTIYDIAAGQVAATLPGYPAYTRMLPFVPVKGTEGGFVAALEGPPGCDGTAVYLGVRLVTCVANAGGPTISPDGSMVALARKTGVTGPGEFPGGGSISLTIFDIVVVDVATGIERVVAQNALGQDLSLPLLWNAAGTHILVRWPFVFGI